MYFGSSQELVAFAVVVGLAVIFCGYLVADGMYHRLKWRRLRRKCRDAETAAAGTAVAGPKD